MSKAGEIVLLGASSIKYALSLGALVAALTFVIMALQPKRASESTKFLLAAAVFTGIFAALAISGGMLTTALTMGIAKVDRVASKALNIFP